MSAIPRLALLNQAQLRAHWPALRAGIEAACEHDRDGMLPEDAFLSLMAGTAGCYAALARCDDGKTVEAFVVVRTAEMFSRQVMIVWLAWNGTDTRAAALWPQIVDIARELGCTRILIESQRPYHRAIPGMVLATHNFHYEVPQNG